MNGDSEAHLLAHPPPGCAGEGADWMAKMLLMITERVLLLYGFWACEFIQPQSKVFMKETEVSTYTFIFLFPK